MENDLDPAKLRMADLRAILHIYDIDAKSSAKKQDLVDLYNQHISPVPARVEEAKRWVDVNGGKRGGTPGPEIGMRRGTPGLEGGRRATPGIGEEDGTRSNEVFAVPAPRASTPKPRGRSTTRKRTPAPSETASLDGSESESNAPKNASVKPKTPRSQRPQTPNKQAMNMEMDEEADELNKSAAAEKEKSPFSLNNPFQSGGETSPDKIRQRRRTTMGVDSRDRSRSRTRRNTSVSRKQRASMGDHLVATSQPLLFSPVEGHPPFSKFMSPPSASYYSDRDNQERRLSLASPASGNSRRRRRSKSPPVIKEEYSLSSILVLCLALLVAFGIWYRSAIIRVGYCGEDGRPAHRKNVGEGMSMFKNISSKLVPSCIPCPEHATCTNGEFINCDKEFVPQTHLLSLGGLLPFPLRCVTDDAKLTQVQLTVDTIRRELSLRAGQVICGHVKKDRELLTQLQGNIMVNGILEEKLKEQLKDRKSPEIGDDAFNEYWQLALEDLSRRPGYVDFVTHPNSGKLYLSSREPWLPLGCKIKLQLVNFLWQHIAIISGSGGALLFLVYIRHYIYARKRDNKLVTKLVQNVLSRLENQERLHYTDPVQFPHPELAIVHLRDALLKGEQSAGRRHKLWERVRRIVENNANVRVLVKEIKGEQHRVWCWVGAYNPNRHVSGREEEEESLYRLN
ncbi:uncharacterized protein VTP21DRAFT_4477 [Calcarisporiella thermophila]|uniref:uncharacterized protein n=1 Tax=Calcarisporiella thermophila TaxID=911321 RepID=UPI00374466F8